MDINKKNIFRYKWNIKYGPTNYKNYYFNLKIFKTWERNICL